jgi:hypothetical protein
MDLESKIRDFTHGTRLGKAARHGHGVPIGQGQRGVRLNSTLASGKNVARRTFFHANLQSYFQHQTQEELRSFSQHVDIITLHKRIRRVSPKVAGREGTGHGGVE